MQHAKILIALMITAAVLLCCRKNNGSDAECFANTATIRQITNAPATVKKNGEKFYLVEQGAIDTRLNPCSLPSDFKVDNLMVIISGEVKSAVQTTNEPCCTENFVVTSISR